jgi:hypothetical protein
MTMTIDHLRVDHRVTVIRDVTDLAGTTLRAGESGILRGLSLDQQLMQLHIVIERASESTDLVFAFAATTGPRNGHMAAYFELGEDVSVPRPFPATHSSATPIPAAPALDAPPAALNTAEWARAANDCEGPDRLETVEAEMRQAIDNIGVAASIAEIYAQRMRAFRRAGNEPRAVAAFKLAVDWMGTYASWATSGGEGAALSYERDQFHAALVREFGYDPSDA